MGVKPRAEDLKVNKLELVEEFPELQNADEHKLKEKSFETMKQTNIAVKNVSARRHRQSRHTNS